MNWKWHIFNADLNSSLGSEQQGVRPVLVISDEQYNLLMPVITILPLTSLKKGRKVYPNEVLVPVGSAGLDFDSIILVHQIRTIAKQRLVKRIGELTDPDQRSQINDALRVHLNL
jgi:mRNA interferase MazF